MLHISVIERMIITINIVRRKNSPLSVLRSEVIRVLRIYPGPFAVYAERRRTRGRRKKERDNGGNTERDTAIRRRPTRRPEKGRYDVGRRRENREEERKEK